MIFNTLKINGKEIYMPNGFQPKRKQIYAAEITTCTGKTIGDLIGWKFDDMTLKWGMLPQSQINTLIAMSGEATMEFADMSGATYTEKIRPISYLSTKTRCTQLNGNVLWKDVELSIEFINAHN